MTDYAQILADVFTKERIIKKNSKLKYYNISISFDIETTSFRVGDEKRAVMYIWAMCIDGHFIYGRTWEEWLQLLDDIRQAADISPELRYIIFVHNLAYETQFFSHYFNFKKVIANSIRKPISLLTDYGLEFRCSYLLSGYSLATLADVKLQGRIEKLVGDLDYDLMRHSETPLTEQEMGYVKNDVRIVYEFIKDEIERNGNIAKIPLTKTGYVRRLLKEKCVGPPPVRHMRRESRFTQFISWMHRMIICSVEEYHQLLRAFAGGFTHCSCINEGRTFENVTSFDFASSYPAIMLSEEFPISAARIVHFFGTHEQKMEQFRDYLNKYCCVFDVQFKGLKASISYEHYISVSKCRGLIKKKKNGKEIKNYQGDNGRIVSADSLEITITNIDFEIIESCYTWESMSVRDFRAYNKGYLPKPILECILELYEAKTELKGVEDRETEYGLAKEAINSIYGASVTRIAHEEYSIMNGLWNVSEEDEAAEIEKYNKSYNRTLFYPWGVFITAYARRNLWTGIHEFKYDYIYSDTDSLKVINADKHMKYINNYNKEIQRKVKKCLEWRELDPKRAAPKTIKGEKKPIGIWENEGTASRFKALRAKCYLTEKNGKQILTVAGLNKNEAIKYMQSKPQDVFEQFNEHLYIPAGHTGKQTHTYCDYPIDGIMKDYTGRKAHYHEESFIHLEPCEYDMDINADYLDFCRGAYYEYIGN